MAVHDKLALALAFGLTSLSTIVVALRFYSRYFLLSKISASDYFMLLALLVSWGTAVVNYYQVVFLNYSTVFDPVTHAINFKEWARIATGGLLTMWIYRIIYLVNLCLVKLSILLFYNYVASAHKTFHRVVKGIMAVVCIATFAMVIASIFVCRPVTDAWSSKVFFNGLKGIFDFKCYNPIYLWFFTASFNLVTDVVIWALPMTFLLNLRTMPFRRRLELLGIFSIGIFAIVASAIRIYVMVLWTSSFEEEGIQTGNLLIWGSVEIHAGIISASIPFLRPLYRKVFAIGRQPRELPSPSPAAKLLGRSPNGPNEPVMPRTPIIPSPPPTATNSSHSRMQSRAPPSPLSPIYPIRPEVATAF